MATVTPATAGVSPTRLTSECDWGWDGHLWLQSQQPLPGHTGSRWLPTSLSQQWGRGSFTAQKLPARRTGVRSFGGWRRTSVWWNAPPGAAALGKRTWEQLLEGVQQESGHAPWCLCSSFSALLLESWRLSLLAQRPWELVFSEPGAQRKSSLRGDSRREARQHAHLPAHSVPGRGVQSPLSKRMRSLGGIWGGHGEELVTS